MKILITNNSLAERAGSELYVRDLAMALLRRGHTPIAYSSRLGEVARELDAATIPVVDDLANLGEPPDIIHGQHHLDTMAALLHFPGVPAVFFCHGWVPWEEAAPGFPRILRQVAIDDLCRERLVALHGVPPERVRVIRNFVDLDRFRPRGPLPKAPARALVFSNVASEANYIPLVRDVCRQAGIGQVDAVGVSSANVAARPEALLGQYDVVFAKARCALEALAVGCSVIACDGAGLGEMVTTENFDRLRRLNFGIRTLNRPISAPALLGELARYDPADAAAVTTAVREEAGLERAVDAILDVYREVLEEHTRAPVADPVRELAAASRYLRVIAPVLKLREYAEARARSAEGDLRTEREKTRDMLDRCAELERRAAVLAEELAAIRRSRGWRLVKALRRLRHGLPAGAWRGLR
jgi:glycosyl transferase family 4